MNPSVVNSHRLKRLAGRSTQLRIGRTASDQSAGEVDSRFGEDQLRERGAAGQVALDCSPEPVQAFLTD